MNALLLTILGLLAASLAYSGADHAGAAIGSQFPERAAKGILGPKGALILVDASAGRMPEIEEDREAARKLGLGIAAVPSKIHAGWYLLDARGAVVSKYLDDDSRSTVAAILVHQFGWTPSQPPTEVEGKQLTAKINASNATARPGQRVTLIVDVDLNPGMHVYAPGVEGYIPIDWKMQDSAAVAVHPPVFPRSQKLFLKAIGETVPAYRNHFRLIRDITIGRSHDDSGKFTVPGSLRYQACDDRVCYIPQELHLTWTLQVP
jgi:Disulphide bond corrector protein DsbC